MSPASRSRWFPRASVAVLAVALLSPAAFADTGAEVDRLISKYHALRQFNGAVLVAEGGRVVLKKGYGLANMEWNIPVSPDTRFRLGSITKQFTSMLVMLLVEEGKLSLDRKLAEMLPFYRKDTGEKVLLRHLLSHTSGIPSYTERPAFVAEIKRNRFAVREFVTKYCSGDLSFEPGARYHYSNSGYFVLGAILEQAAGKPYEQILQERILGPLKMTSTGYDHPAEVLPRRAAGYVKTLDGFRNAAYIDMSVPYAAGALYSTVEDLTLWDQALYTNKLLSGKGRETLFTPVKDEYAFGWVVREDPIGPSKAKRRVTRHAGGIDGFNTVIVRVPEDRHLVVLLNNTGDAPVDAMSSGVLDILYGRKAPPPKKPIGEVLMKAIAANGVGPALDEYRELKRTSADLYDFREEELNILGYQLLGEQKTEAAIAVFEANLDAFPKSWNVYDSLAEGQAAAGRKEAAIRNYRKSLELNPSNTNAADQIAKLEKK